MTNADGTSSHSAAASMVGYIYQLRAALLWALQRGKERPGSVCAIERLDDVSFSDPSGGAVELIQTKHQVDRVADLSDSSVDLWKSLRVWIDGTTSGAIPRDATLTLVTTAAAANDSAASLLRIRDRNVPRARSSLDLVANTSSNVTTAPARAAYLRLTTNEREALLSRVVVADLAPNILALDEELTAEVFHAVDRVHLPSFLQRLEGWWFRRALNHLVTSGAPPINLLELDAEMSRLREQFGRESLPIDDDLLAIAFDEAAAAAYGEFVFVKQLELCDMRPKRVVLAIQDYFRATSQRTRWLTEDLVVSEELSRYEDRLSEEWTRVWEAMCNELDQDETETMKRKAARAVIRWADEVAVHIRPEVTEPFVSRGSFHILADEARVGWHPEFRAQLATLLEGAAE